jgi:hypothetical protein
MSALLGQSDERSGRTRDCPAGTSESGTDAVQARRWRNWLVMLPGVAAALTAVLCVGIVLLDPYSTGRLTPIERIDVATSDVQIGHAARVRDSRYDAAVIGDSHAILIDPARLSDATHLHVVQLASLATVPREQFMVARAFVRHHRQAAALIVVLDDLSCLATERTFPFFFPAFLFEGSDLDYLRHIYTSAALQAAVYRVLMMLGLAEAPQRLDGFNPVLFHRPETRPERLLRIAHLQRPTQGPVPGTPLPAFAPLEALVAELDPATLLLLYFTPVPANTLPAPASPAAQWLDSCKARYRALAARRPHTALVDHMVEDDFTRDIENFEDPEHLRNDLAPVLEREIAEALRALMTENARP